MMDNAIYLGILWMAYYAMHSALATDGIRRFFARNLPTLSKSYRLLFTIVAILNFLLLLWFHSLVPSKSIFATNYLSTAVSLLFCIASLIIFVLALRQFPFLLWIVENTASHKSYLQRQGIYRVVRHPHYFAFILGLVALIFAFPSWKNLVFALITIIYIVIGSLLEEQKLISRFGQEYIDYKQQVKMLIPYII